jgi:GxxExxY protein
METLRHEELSSAAIGELYTMFNDVGPGFPEPVYQRGLCVGLERRGIACAREVRYTVKYLGVEIGSFRADLVVQDALIVEVKCAERIEKGHVRQLLYYLKASGLRVGLILNLGDTPSFKRVVR